MFFIGVAGGGALEACKSSEAPQHAPVLQESSTMKPESDLSRLIDAMREPKGGIGEAMALVQRGETSIPTLVEATVDSEPRVRGLSCFALGELKTPSNAVIRALRLRLDDTDEQVRFVAARALGQLKQVPADVSERLEAMRRIDPSPNVRGGAEEALRAINGNAPSPLHSVALVLQAAEGADPQAREAAIDELGRMGLEGSDPAQADRVLTVLTSHLLHDDYFQSRASAALALWKIGRTPELVLDALTKAVSDRHLVVQAMAAQVLGNFGPRAGSVLPKLKVLAADKRSPEMAKMADEAITRINTR